MLAIDLLQNWVMIWAHIVKVDWGILMDRAIEQLSLVFLNLLHLQTYSIYSKKKLTLKSLKPVDLPL